MNFADQLVNVKLYSKTFFDSIAFKMVMVQGLL